MVKIDWKGNLVFEATAPSGNKIVFDTHPETGGRNQGPTPAEAFLAALGACTAMDVVSILEKKRQTVTAYRIEIEGERTPSEDFPRPFAAIAIRHVVSGVDLDPAAVARAVQLSDEKYCTIAATLRERPDIRTEWAIE